MRSGRRHNGSAWRAPVFKGRPITIVKVLLVLILVEFISTFFVFKLELKMILIITGAIAASMLLYLLLLSVSKRYKSAENSVEARQ